MVEYYRQRRAAGLIISEGVPISDRARGYLHTPALWNEAQAAGWHKVTAAVQAGGSKIFAQLWHCGRISHARLHADGSPPAGVSAKAAGTQVLVLDDDGQPLLTDNGTPAPLSLAEIRDLVQEFVTSARLAKEAGFDGVEIHGANGYLLDQFRCPLLNERTDAYGGSLENRYRLLLEVVDAVSAVFPPSRIGVRQSPYGQANSMAVDPTPLETYPYLAQELDRRGIGFLHLVDQSGGWIHDPAHPLFPAIRAAFRGALIACGGFHKLASAEAMLARGADLVAAGKPFISNPDLLTRWQRDIPLTPWDPSLFYAGGAKGYIDYPAVAIQD
jgi:N-ethylmaleimide reductase